MPDWFPDWTGHAAAIVASGPSTKAKNVDLLRGKVKVIAIKENVELAPWADVLYGCDAPWWINNLGAPKFRGLKITASEMLRPLKFDVRTIKVQGLDDRMHFDRSDNIGAGGNSGFQALNLAVAFGAERIALIGFDCSGAHWYGRNRGPGRTNPDEWNFRRWRKAFEVSSVELKDRGFDVVNCSPDSTLTCFRKQTVAAALKEWGL